MTMFDKEFTTEGAVALGRCSRDDSAALVMVFVMIRKAAASHLFQNPLPLPLDLVPQPLGAIVPFVIAILALQIEYNMLMILPEAFSRLIR
jgi:hypothetical protein